MDILIVLVFISLVFVAGALLLFLRGIHGGDFDHGDRLSLLPLEKEPAPSVRDPGDHTRKEG